MGNTCPILNYKQNTIKNNIFFHEKKRIRPPGMLSMWFFKYTQWSHNGKIVHQFMFLCSASLCPKTKCAIMKKKSTDIICTFLSCTTKLKNKLGYYLYQYGHKDKNKSGYHFRAMFSRFIFVYNFSVQQLDVQKSNKLESCTFEKHSLLHCRKKLDFY